MVSVRTARELLWGETCLMPLTAFYPSELSGLGVGFSNFLGDHADPGWKRRCFGLVDRKTVSKDLVPTVGRVELERCPLDLPRDTAGKVSLWSCP